MKKSRPASKAFIKALEKNRKPKRGKAKVKSKPKLKTSRTPSARAVARALKTSVKKKGGGFKTHSMRVTASSKKHTWRTPRTLIDIIEKVAGKIGLDPCADVKDVHHFAKTNWTGYNERSKKGVDGLRNPWRGRGVVYCNPPYGRGSIIKWLRHAIKQFVPHEANGVTTNDFSKDHCFILVPARPDTKWFQEEVLSNMGALCFWKGRLKFSKSDPAPFPSLIIYLGPKPKRFKKIFRKYGWIVKKAP